PALPSRAVRPPHPLATRLSDTRQRRPERTAPASPAIGPIPRHHQFSPMCRSQVGGDSRLRTDRYDFTPLLAFRSMTVPTTSSRSSELINLEERWGAPNYRPLSVVIERAEGAWVYDVDGNRYLDCLSAYSAVNQGHAHPRILETMIEQAHRVTLTSRAFRNDQLPLFCQELARLCDMEMVLPMNTGAEAVETAVKAARRYGYRVKGIPADRAEIIVCANNFHGRTTTIVGFSSDEEYKDGFGPFAPGFVTVPFGDIDALKAAIRPETCAFLFEPIDRKSVV